MSKIKLGVCLTGSFCTFAVVIETMNQLASTYDLVPILSYHAAQLDTKFGKSADFINEIERICHRKIIRTIPDAEPIGPSGMTDLMLVAPCTGNTLAKLALSITDTPVTMAVKSHLRNQRPVVIAISTNDALSGCAKNIGQLLNQRHYYFVPYGEDHYLKKPNSMVADFSQIQATLALAQLGKQLQPMVIAPYAPQSFEISPNKIC